MAKPDYTIFFWAWNGDAGRREYPMTRDRAARVLWQARNTKHISLARKGAGSYEMRNARSGSTVLFTIVNVDADTFYS